MATEFVKRLAPTKDTLNLLFSLSGNVCAFPGCNHKLFDEDNNFIAQVCHIESANEGGERFNKNSTNEERRQYNNLIILCYEHHKITDNTTIYNKQKMLELKSEHEKKFRLSPTYANNDQIDIVYYNETQKIQEISIETKKIIDNQAEQTEILKQLLAYQLSTKESQIEIKTDYDKQIDIIISLRIKSNHKTAISLFNEMKSNDWDNLSDREKYRVQANLGILHLDLIENDQAAKYFIDALQYQSNDINAIDYGILGYSLIGNDREANLLIKKGLNIDPKNVGIYASLIRTKRDKPLKKILSLVPIELQQETEIAFQIFLKCKNEENYEDSITWGQIALNGCKEENPEMMAILASTILESIQNPFKVVTGQVSQEAKNKANYAIKLFTQAWENVKSTEIQTEKVWYLINRGVAKTYIGDFEGSYEDAKEAALISNDNIALRHVIVGSMRLGRQKEATETIKKLKEKLSSNELFETEFFEAQFFHQIGEPDIAIKMIENLLLNEIDDSLKFRILELLTQYYIDTNDLAKAKIYNKSAFALQTNFLSPSIMQGKILIKENFNEQAISIFLDILSKINEKTLEVDIYDLSIQFEELGMLKESIFLLEKISNPDILSHTTKKLLQSYYKFGENFKLLKSCENLINVLGPISFVSELKSYVFEKINDSKNAIITCQQYLKIYPQDQYIQIRLALIHSRLGEWQDVRNIIKSINHVDRSLPMNVQFSLASICYKCGEKDKFLNFSYETRRQFQDNVSAHENFINLGLMISQGNDNPSDPIEVDENCMVTITDGNKAISYLIENRSDLQREKGEISPISTEGIALIGKKVGENAIMGKYNQNFIIEEIKHKYNAAMSESFNLIQTTFATQTSFQKFTIGKTGNLQNDFKVIFQMLDDNSKQTEIIEENYKLKTIPLSTIAKIKSLNIINVWSAYIADEKLGLFTTVDKIEIEQAYKNFDNKRPILFDIISLCTISQLNLYNEIKLLNCDLFVTESTIMTIQSLINELKSSDNLGPLYIGKKSDQYFRQISTPEEIEKHINHYSDLIEWIKFNCKSLPCTAALKINGKIKEEYDELLGESTFDSIITAQENNFVLYAEEELIRMLALQQHNVVGSATFITILYLFSRKMINYNRYLQLYISLIELNYNQLPIDSNILHSIAIKTKYKLNYPLNIATRCLNSNLLDIDFILIVLCEYFTSLYKKKVDFIFEKDIKELRKEIVIYTLSILNEKYSIIQFEKKLLQMLRTKLSFVDPDYISISKQVNAFCHPWNN